MPNPFLTPLGQAAPDGGPIYVETPLDLSRDSNWIVEPWNTGSALLFVIIPIVWACILPGRWREHPFLTMCLPVLAAGGIGGVLFHGLRFAAFFRYLDVVPIYILGLGVSIWLWVRVGPKLLNLVGLIAVLGLLQALAFYNLPRHWAINVSYAMLGTMVLVPVIIALFATSFRSGGWVGAALTFFAIALTCRYADAERPPLLPMGTHWLWHVFGALTTVSLSIYVYWIEGVPLRNRANRS